MPLFVDGVEINSVYVDGVEQDSVWADGVQVFSNVPPWPSVFLSVNSQSIVSSTPRTVYGWTVSALLWRGHFEFFSTVYNGAWKTVNADGSSTPAGDSCASGALGFQSSGVQIRARNLTGNGTDGGWVTFLVGGGFSGNSNGSFAANSYGMHTSGNQMRGAYNYGNAGWTYGPWRVVT